MSGESQRSLDRDQYFPQSSGTFPSPRRGLDAGELAIPSSTARGLSGVSDDELRRGLHIDRVLTEALHSPPLPRGMLGRLHRLVDQLASAP